MTRRLLFGFAGVGVAAVVSVTAGIVLWLRHGCPDVGMVEESSGFDWVDL